MTVYFFLFWSNVRVYHHVIECVFQTKKSDLTHSQFKDLLKKIKEKRFSLKIYKTKKKLILQNYPFKNLEAYSLIKIILIININIFI